MVEFPRSSRLIPNPVNNIPGFSLYDHHFVPGFPQMAWPMLEWVLDNYYQNIKPNKKIEQTIIADALEGQIIHLMRTVNHKFADVSAFSLPKIVDKKDKKELLLGIKGIGPQVSEAMQYMQSALDENNIHWKPLD